MYRLRGDSDGFTLIEIMMVLAISSLLAVSLLRQYTLNQRRARFTAAVEQVASRLEQVRNEANSSYTTGSGDTPGTIFFAKAVQFSTGQPALTSKVLTADRVEGALSNIQVNTATLATYTIPWGVQYQAGPGTGINSNGYQTVVFARSPLDGTLETYVVAGTDPSLTDSALYNNTATAILTLQESGGLLQADIIINASTDEISRRYNN